MATFAELKSEVQSLLIDADTVVQNLTGKWVNRAIRKLEAKHNFKVMEASQSFTTTAFQRRLGSRPGDWKMARGKPYYIESLGEIRKFGWAPSESEALAATGNNVDLDWGRPRLIFDNDLPGEFDIYPYPDGLSDYDDGEYRVVVPYWKFLGQLISDSDTNWFTTNAEQWIIYQSVAEGFYANEDEARAQTWETRGMREYKDVLWLDKARRMGDVENFIPHLGAISPHTDEE